MLSAYRVINEITGMDKMRKNRKPNNIGRRNSRKFEEFTLAIYTKSDITRSMRAEHTRVLIYFSVKVTSSRGFGRTGKPYKAEN